MKRSPGIIAEQRALTEALEARLVEESGTPDAPVVVRDPYGVAPLSALVCFTTAQAEAFSVQLSDAQGRTYLRYNTPSATAHRIIVPALVNGEACSFAAVGTDGTRVQLALPLAEVEAPMLVAMEGAAPENTLLYALPADGAGQPVAVNAFGDLCWTLTLPLNHRLTFLENGHFLCGAPLQLAPPYSGTAIWEMDALGHIYREYRFEDGFVSDFARLPDGAIVAITQTAWQGTARDVLVWLDGENGREKQRMNAADVLPKSNGTAGQSGSDWFQGTSLRYDAATGLLYWSGLAQNVVLEIDAATAEVRRIIASTEGWEEQRVAHSEATEHITTSVDGWNAAHTRLDLFTRPVLSGTFEEAYGVQRWGDALYYVNANRYPLGRKLASTAFNINRLDLKSGRVSRYLPNNEGLISPVFCDLTLYNEETTLVLAGGLSNSDSLRPAVFARERQEDILLSAQAWYYVNGERQTTWRFDDNLVQVDLWQPETLSFTTGAETVLGEWAPSFEIDIELPHTSEGRLEDDMHIEFWQDDARLYLSGTFYKGEACTLILRRGEEQHPFFLTTNRKPFGTEWLYTYGASDVERRLNWAIPCAHLKGSWNIDLLIDDILYHTGETAVF